MTFDFGKILCNLGMYFDKTISMEQQASAITRSCFQQIRNIGRIRSLISVDACRTLVSSLVISRLDYGNALLFGTNNKIINKLQRVQNTAARLITRKRKYDSITPVIISLHWLPFITVANTNFLYMCTTHSMARLLATFKK